MATESVIHHIQPSFSGGEFAPALYKRVDLEKFAVALRRARNFGVHPEGGASNRPGFKYVATAKFANRKARIVSFEFSVTQAYAIEFGHLYCRFHLNGGTLLELEKPITGATQANPVVIESLSHGNTTGKSVVISDIEGMTELNGKTFQITVIDADHFSLDGVDGTDFSAYTSGGFASQVYEVVTPYEESNLPDLKFTQSADVLYIVHPGFAPRTLTRLFDSPPHWQLDLFAFANGPFMLSNATAEDTITPSGTTGSITLSATAEIFQSSQVGGLFRIRHTMPGQALSGSLSSTGASSSIPCGGTWRIITHGTWAATLQIQQSFDGGTTWTLLRQFSSASDFNVDTFGTEDGPFLIRLNVSSYSSGMINVDLSSDPYEATGIVKITGYTDSTHVSASVLTPIGEAAATWDWAEGSWSDFRGYPQCVVFFEDRLCFSCTSSEPDTIWMSQTGDYTNFGTSDPLVDSDAIGNPLPSRKMNGIANLVGLQKILALTSATDWSVGPAPGQAVVTPTQTYTRVESYRGSARVEPAIVGNRALYVQPMGTVVRDIGYDYQVDGYTGANLSLLSSHLFRRYTILEMAYQQEPDSLVWCVRSDGVLLSLTYMKEEQINAWTWHDTAGKFESVCSIPADGYNELWVITLRDGVRFVERLSSPLRDPDPKQQFYVDCGLSYDSPIEITGITKASPAVVTAAGHGLTDGELVDLSDIEGMEINVVDDFGDTVKKSLLNGIRFQVANVTTDTFELTDEETGEDVDSSDASAYVSGGSARKPVTSVSGLDHLEGKTVSILADGNVLPQQMVENGSVTLNPASSIVHVGLAYTAQLQTLPFELKLQDGTLQDRAYRIPHVSLSLLESRGGFIGTSEKDLTEIAQRTNEPLGSPIALFTGDLAVPLDGTFEIGASVFYEQRDPLPVTVLAVLPHLEVGGSLG